MTISAFSERYRWLSNFWPCIVEFSPGWRSQFGMQFTSVEHAYQAAKSHDENHWYRIAAASTAADAKRLGRTVVLRPDWEFIKLDVMRELLAQKFKRGSALAANLIATDGEDLVEGNTWGDTFWGVCKGVGENWLGKLLMEQRARLLEHLPEYVRPGYLPPRLP